MRKTREKAKRGTKVGSNTLKGTGIVKGTKRWEDRVLGRLRVRKTESRKKKYRVLEILSVDKRGYWERQCWEAEDNKVEEENLGMRNDGCEGKRKKTITLEKF